MWRYLVTFVLAAQSAHAILRFPCSQLVTERLDPLVTPNEVSPHLHQVIGGSAFNITMDPNNDLPAMSQCTTCRFVEDKSNYWTAVMYFKHQNGSYLRVSQMANHNTGPGLQDGGMTVYYFQPPSGKAVAFKKGFRMRVGDPNRRYMDLPSGDARRTATTMRCFTGNSLGSGTPGSGAEDSYAFPKGKCTGGIRSNIYFPGCWDGKNLDSPDHESHVAYPNGGFFGNSCPTSHPVRLPLLFMEIVWDTRPYNDAALWPKDGSQPFVWSNGDATGFGQHADYVFGWEGDSLQRAMDTCTNQNGIPSDCKVLTTQGINAMNTCKRISRVPELVEGAYLNTLPGCNKLQTGPDQDAVIPNCSAPNREGGTPVQSIVMPIVTPPWAVCGTSALEPRCDSVPVTKTAPGSRPTTIYPPAASVPAPQPTLPPPAPTNPPPAPTNPAPVPSSAPPAPPGTVPKNGQCGGAGWAGPTACQAGLTCTVLNDWYSQCL